MSNFEVINSFKCAMTEKNQAENMKLQISSLDYKVNVPKDYVAVISHRSKRCKHNLI